MDIFDDIFNVDYFLFFKEPESDPLMDLDRFDPLASPSNALDYSSLSPEELDKLIDHVYSAQLSPQCEAAIIGKVSPLFPISSFPIELL